MPEYETSADRSRRPFADRAGEVTKKKGTDGSTDKDNEEDPPAFNGRKIGGAKDLTRKDDIAMQHGNEPKENDIVDIGVRINDLSIPNTKKCTQSPYAGPRGKTRFWACVSEPQKEAWNAFSFIWVSRTCKNCLDEDVSCSGWERDTVTFQQNDFADGKLRCQKCIQDRKPCLRMVEFDNKGARAHPQWDVTNPLSTFKEWLYHIKGTPLEIVTPDSEQAPRYDTSIRGTTSTAAPAEASILTRPTYGKVRQAYEDLAGQGYRNGSADLHINGALPFWDEDRVVQITTQFERQFIEPSPDQYETAWAARMHLQNPRTIPTWTMPYEFVGQAPPAADTQPRRKYPNGSAPTQRTTWQHRTPLASLDARVSHGAPKSADLSGESDSSGTVEGSGPPGELTPPTGEAVDAGADTRRGPRSAPEQDASNPGEDEENARAHG